MVFGPVETQNHNFVVSKILLVSKWGVLFTEWRCLASTGHSPCIASDSSGHSFTNWNSPPLFKSWVSHITTDSLANFLDNTLILLQPLYHPSRPEPPSLLPSRLLSKNVKSRIYKTMILPVVLYACETWSLALREERRLGMFVNRCWGEYLNQEKLIDGRVEKTT
jgi:hypothetical protein